MAIADAVAARFQPLKTMAFWVACARQVIKKGIVPIPLAVAGIVAYLAPHSSLRFWENHPGLALVFLFPVLLWPVWKREATQRRIVALGGTSGSGRSPKQKTRPLKAPLQPYWRSFSQWVDIVLFNDTRTWRVAYVAAFVVLMILLLTQPVNANSVLQAPRSPSGLLPQLPIQLVAPLAFYAFIAMRCHAIGRLRGDIIKVIYNVAANAFKYPSPGTSLKVAGDDAQLLTAACIEVKAWETLTRPHEFTIPTSKSTSATDERAWAELGANLNQRLKEHVSEDGFHVARDPSGRGCAVTPADYPRAVLWDGEQHPDLMTFFIGPSLDALNGRWSTVTFGVTSPHFIGTGPTGTGKTSFAEIVLAQATTKPMPWDSTLQFDCHIIDPKDSLKNRWEGRANITATSGVHDSINDDGDPISGIEALAEHMKLLGKELDDRMIWLSQFKNAANWKDVPDEEKKKARFRPLIIVTDEYTDHTEPDKDATEQGQRDNTAKEIIVSITKEIFRKGRSVGIHVVLIVQRGNMSILGSQIVTNGQGRYIMGNTDPAQYKSMLGTTDVPVLPAQTWNSEEEKFEPIPGRARLQNTGGGQIIRIQVLYFGKGNVETLDKWLPRDGAAAVIDGEVVNEDSTETPEQTSAENVGQQKTLPWVVDDEDPDPLPPTTSNDPPGNDSADTPPWEDLAEENSPTPSTTQSSEADAATVTKQSKDTPTRPPATTPARATAKTAPDAETAKVLNDLAEVTEKIKPLNAISPHTITDQQRDELSSLFEKRKELIRKRTALQRKQSPAPRPRPRSGTQPAPPAKTNGAPQPAAESAYQDRDASELFG